MCIIVDANAGHKMHSDDAAGALVLRWILTGGGKAVVSQRLLSELNKTAFGQTLKVIEQAGKLCRCDEEIVEGEFTRLNEASCFKSNDPHILALIRATGCELVFTHDKPLHEDIKNREIIRDCKIFQDAKHHRLLGICRCY